MRPLQLLSCHSSTFVSISISAEDDVGTWRKTFYNIYIIKIHLYTIFVHVQIEWGDCYVEVLGNLVTIPRNTICIKIESWLGYPGYPKPRPSNLLILLLDVPNFNNIPVLKNCHRCSKTPKNCLCTIFTINKHLTSPKKHAINSEII